MEAKFSPRVKDMISYSREEAVRLSNEFVSPEHLLLGMVKLNEGKAIQMLNEFQLDLIQLKKELEKVKELEAAMGGMQLNGIAQFLIENPIQNK